ncbi:MAG: hypothetical protein NTX42_01065 [Methanothrix sp.]|nr:hypothetical protein [Methanothrix sp.]
MRNLERGNRDVLSIKRQPPQPSSLNEPGSLTRKMPALIFILCILFYLSNTAIALQLTKTSVPATSVNFGASVTYTYKITNNNAVSLNSLSLYDDRLGLIPIGSPNLAINEVRTVTATHIINATDMPGPLKNNAQAFARDPNNNPVSSLNLRSKI